jgi:hypothetical protein
MLNLTYWTELDSAIDDQFEDPNINTSEIEEEKKPILVTIFTQNVDRTKNISIKIE